MVTGSPPHTRGKHCHILIRFPLRRITPAHAGKTIQKHNTPYKPQDHPRTRGENHSKSLLLPVLAGSPPHTRGKQKGANIVNYADRITPAHAGKTFPSWLSPCFFQDHPRTRGENSVLIHQIGALPGSPPHTRGKQPPVCSLQNGHRITPAHAGKTGRSHETNIMVQDHPRTRGENK